MKCECVKCECVDCHCKKDLPCRESIKTLKKYLKDTEQFLSMCDKCPVAQHLLDVNRNLSQQIPKTL